VPSASSPARRGRLNFAKQKGSRTGPLCAWVAPSRLRHKQLYGGLPGPLAWGPELWGRGLVVVGSFKVPRAKVGRALARRDALGRFKAS
jgi:hypothetical protein